MALLVTLLAGASIAIGGLIVRLARHNHRVGQVSVALAFGALVALLAFDLLPEVVKTYKEGDPLVPIALVAFGFVLLKVIDALVPDHDEKHAGGHEGNNIHIGLMTAFALSIHNIIEGMSIYGLAASSLSQGAIYALGIMLHNIPMGMLIFAALEHEHPLLKHSVLSLVTFSTLIGGLVMMAVSTALPELMLGVPLCVAAGMIIYIAAMELLPRMLRTKPVQVSAIAAACGFILVTLSVALG